MHVKKVGPIGLMLALLFLPGCKRSARNDFQTVRFIDLLSAENIKQSPFLKAGGVEPSPLLNPLESTPLQNLGSPENPHGLKKKLNLKGLVIEILFSPPKSKYSFEIVLPPDAVLEFGTGIIRDKNFEKLKESLGREPQGVQFIVRIDIQGRQTIIFQKQLPLPPYQDMRTLEFSMERVRLPPHPQRARVTFLARGDEGVFSFWYNPVIYTTKKNLRNVVLISIDTLRADHLGCFGYHKKTSPSIDAMARDSVLFEETYASSPWTLPSHVSLFTSLSGINHQVYGSRDRIDPSQTMLAEVLRRNNLFCSAFAGSGYVNSLYGFSKGFEYYHESEGLNTLMNSAERMSEVVSEWLPKNADKDFFLFLHTYQVHSPYFCPPPYNTMFLQENPRWPRVNLMEYLGGKPGIFRELTEGERQNIIGLYDGEISYVDDKLIKPLIEKLKEMRLYDQTMIVFISDHGEEFFEHGAWLHGQSLYEESLRVPLIIKFPGSKYRGKRIHNLVRLIDVMPTILEEFGIDSKGMNLEGESLIPVIRGKEKGDRMFLADTLYLTNERSLGQEMDSSETRLPDKIAFGTRTNKLIYNRELTEKEALFYSPPPPSLSPVELYNLKNDPREKANLAAQKTGLVAQMAEKVRKIYGKKAKTRRAQIELDEKLKEELRALGYIR